MTQKEKFNQGLWNKMSYRHENHSVRNNHAGWMTLWPCTLDIYVFILYPPSLYSRSARTLMTTQHMKIFRETILKSQTLHLCTYRQLWNCFVQFGHKRARKYVTSFSAVLICDVKTDLCTSAAMCFMCLNSVRSIQTFKWFLFYIVIVISP